MTDQAMTAAEDKTEITGKPTSSKVRRIRAILVALFPACFAAEGSKTKLPLKRDIHQDIYAALESKGFKISRQIVSRMLHDYTAGPKYARALISGCPRLDLDGKPVESVPDHIQELARQRLAGFDAKRAARQAVSPQPAIPADA